MTLNNLIEVYLPTSTRTPKGIVSLSDAIFNKVYQEVRDILLVSCTGCGEREEIGYFKNQGSVYKMKNVILYAYFSDDVTFDVDYLHKLINEGLKQDCSMICINHVSSIK